MIINKVTHEKKSRLIRIDYFEDNIEKILLISPTDIIKDWQAVEQGLHPTSGSLRYLQETLTPRQLSALKDLFTPPTCG